MAIKSAIPLGILHIMQCIFVAIAIVEGIEHFVEYVVGRGGVEERHA